MDPHSYALKRLYMFGVANNVISLNANQPPWKVKLHTCNQLLGSVCIRN